MGPPFIGLPNVGYHPHLDRDVIFKNNSSPLQVGAFLLQNLARMSGETDHIMITVSLVYLWTWKSPLNFGGYPCSGSGLHIQSLVLDQIRSLDLDQMLHSPSAGTLVITCQSNIEFMCS